MMLFSSIIFSTDGSIRQVSGSREKKRRKESLTDERAGPVGRYDMADLTEKKIGRKS